MNQYETAVFEAARKWYEAWGNSGVDELWSVVGEMCEHERLRQPTPRAPELPSCTFNDGCMWEGGDWEISLNHECSNEGGGIPCKHCYGEEVKHRVSAYNSGYTEKIWICPSVVIAKNEGGYNSTGVCLQCILEAAEHRVRRTACPECGKDYSHYTGCSLAIELPRATHRR